MTEFLETTVDKFTFKVATDRLYSAEGLWARPEGNRVRIGLSDFVQQHNGDVAFAEVKAVGTNVTFGDEIATIETIKVNLSLISPVTGKVVEVNPAMSTAPEAINQDPFGAGGRGQVSLALLMPPFLTPSVACPHPLHMTSPSAASVRR